MSTWDEREARDDAQAEFEKDQLVRLLAPLTLARLDPAKQENEAFFDWMARETREELSARERQAEALGAATFAWRVHERVLADLVSVRLVDDEPIVARQAELEPLALSVQSAARYHMAPRVEPAVAAGVGREIWDEPAETWVQVPDELPAGRYIAMPVTGDSMVPLFRGGDLLLVRVGVQFTTGDVIVARCGDDGYVVKRVGRVRQDVVDLVSLNSAYAALTVPRTELSVIGTVVMRWRVRECATDRR